MDFFTLTEKRQSVRSYLDREIEADKVSDLLQAVNRAPSAGNLQAFEVVVARSSAARRSLATAAGQQEFVAQAPLALVFCAHPARSSQKYQARGEQLYSIQDATIACTYAMLAATALGLASVWVGAFDAKQVRTALHLPAGWLPIAILPLGYPAESPRQTLRRKLDDLVHEL